MTKKNPYGSAPVDEYFGKILFVDPQSEEEWHSQPESMKKFAMDHLNYVSSKMTNKIAIEMLCNVINDLVARINALEKRESKPNP